MKTITVAMWDPGLKIQDLNLKEKIDLLEEKFKEAYQLAMSESKNSGTTFLFICPEFTLLDWNNSKTNYAYPKTVFLDAEKRLQKLANDYPDAIIIPGTVYIEKKLDLDDINKQKKYADAIKKWQFNHIRTPKNVKEEVKDKSLIKNTASIFFHSQKDKPKRYSKQIEAGEYFDASDVIFYPGHSSSFFNQNGIRFGIEICADHKDGILRSQQTKTNESIDVHLIVANVIKTISGKVANNGENLIVVNCAGNFSYSPTAAREVGVWVTDEQGCLEPVKMSKVSTKNLLVYPDISIPNQKCTPNPT